MTSLTHAERAPIDLLLSRLLLVELDADLLAALRQPEIAQVLARLDPDLEASLAAPWTPEREAEAQEEYARLFLLPGGTPPFASAWLAGEREQLGAQLTTFVSRVLEVLGRRASRAGANLPLDHLGLLLELAATASCSERASEREVGRHLREQALGPWVTRFGNALQTQARLPLYRAAGALLARMHT